MECERYKSGTKGKVRTGLLQRNTLPPTFVKYEVIDGMAIFEGDIILGRAQDLDISDRPRTRSITISGNRYRWANGRIPFHIDNNLPNQARVNNAIQHWEQNTGIRFIQRTNEADFITFRTGTGCSSSVGRSGGEQFINLAAGCNLGNVIHEIGHTVGLWHEQSREDRDKYVTINWENIEPTASPNFNQHITDGDDKGPYDYDSIMHYGEYDFALIPNIPTIITPANVGQRNGLSAEDIAAVRYLYCFQRRGDSADLAGEVSDIASITNGNDQVITSVRTSSKKLKLISWKINNNGSVSRLNDSGDQAGEASHLSIAKGSKFVVACRTGSGKLKLISWDINNNGIITRKGDSGDQAGEASKISIIHISNDLFITACRTGSNNLKLISWQLNNNGSLTRLSDSGNQAGEVSEVSLVNIPMVNNGRVVTSVRDGSGRLKVIFWSVSTKGIIKRLGDSGSQAGQATLIRSALDAHGYIITSVKTSDGNLKIISWAVSSDGYVVSRLGDSGTQAGGIGDNALMSRAPGVISAVRTSDGDLKLISWSVSETGWISRIGDSYNLAGEASLINLCQESFIGNNPIVTSVKTGSGKLRLIVWNDES